MPESAVSAVQSRLNRVLRVLHEPSDAANCEEPMSPVGYHHDHSYDHESHHVERGLHHDDDRDPFSRGNLYHDHGRDHDHAGGAGLGSPRPLHRS